MSSAARRTSGRCSPKSRWARRTPASCTRPTRERCRTRCARFGSRRGGSRTCATASASSRRARTSRPRAPSSSACSGTRASAFCGRTASCAGETFSPSCAVLRRSHRCAALPRAAGCGDLHAGSSGPPRPAALERRRHERARRQPPVDGDCRGADPALRDAARVLPRDAPLPRPRLPRHGRGAAARAAARRRRDRPLRRLRAHRPLRVDARRARVADPVHARRGRLRGRARREPALRSHRDRRVRGCRSRPRRRVAHARRRPGEDVLPGGAAARGRWARCRRSPLLRPRARGVRRDDHVRRQPPRRDPDAPACDLRAVLPRLRHGPCDGRAARPRQRRAPPLVEAEPLLLAMAALSADFRLGLRSFELSLGLAVERTVALVGPSGAGKTSVLRVIAGLARPDAGRVELDGETWVDVERGMFLSPERRRVGLVFQEYALFPHLSVRQNVAFGGRERVDDLLERFRIAHLAASRPRELSGGERQRVALARALAREPGVLLLDEPLSALDAHTKATVRVELEELLRGLELPTLIVTHDYEDAAALAETVGVLVEGSLRQLGSPEELVSRPADPFVASFTGANLLRGHAELLDYGLTSIRLETGEVVYSTDRARGEVGVVVYPWDVSVGRVHVDGSALNLVAGEVTSVVPVGNRVRVRIGPLTAEVTAASAEKLELARGGTVYASFKATGTRLVPLS